MWPFKKKELTIKRGNFWYPMENTPITWSSIFDETQNNKLLIKYFNELAEMQAPIMKYADLATLVKIKSNIPEVENLLFKPNYYQGWAEYISLFMIYKRLLGNAIVDAFTPMTMDGRKPKSLYNLPPQYITIKTSNDKDFRFNKIESYVFDTKDPKMEKLLIEPEYILHVKESNPNFTDNEFLWGLSRYASCYRNIETLSNGYDAKKNIYTNGPRLIITGKAQNEFANINTSEDISEVQDRYKKYGMRKQDYNAFITDVPLDVNNVSFSINDLQINEMKASDFQTLCDAQGIDARVFSDLKGSTFDNKKTALYDFANNAFRSEMDSIIKDHEGFLKRWWPNLELKADYSNISEINIHDEEMYNSLFEDVKLGLMTRNQYFELIGKEIVNIPEFNDYYFWNNGWFSVKNINNGNNL